MTDPTTVAGWLLILGPVLGVIPVANPALVRIWTMPRLDHLATVGAHRRGWALLNIGFGFATMVTTAGLFVMADALGDDGIRGVALMGIAVAYAVGGGLWCAVLAIRTRTTPTLADLVAASTETEPGETLLGAATGGLFGGFVLLTAAAITALGLVLLVAGGVAAPVAIVTTAAGVFAGAWLVVAGDIIPAVLYPPTTLIGVALLAGWS